MNNVKDLRVLQNYFPEKLDRLFNMPQSIWLANTEYLKKNSQLEK